ncbi:hypothetical protein H6G08_31630 [Calothrix anomala FACHB-343]|uniref:Uncharacterized protein n=2 Tax=Calothrix TaxID=1186 RepID=A0ABR8B3N8_9CYAN|nr:hypothetical protein [Calothrix anomala FACHB-343]
MPNAQCPMPHAPCPMPNMNFIRKDKRISVIVGLWGGEDQAVKREFRYSVDHQSTLNEMYY